MGWLEFCKRNWPTHEWKRDGCSLVEMTRDQYLLSYRAQVDDYERKNNFFMLRESRFGEKLPVAGINPHLEGRLHVDRGRIVIDIPFWATKWLVFERDKRCQDCGCYGWESHWQHSTGTERGHDVYDRPILQADVDAHNAEMVEYAKTFSKPSDIKDWFRYANPQDSRGMQVHHIVAVVDGGSNCTHNAMLLCWKCHLRRKGKGGVPVVLDGIQAKLVY
jgi:hypothetical protein